MNAVSFSRSVALCLFIGGVACNQVAPAPRENHPNLTPIHPTSYGPARPGAVRVMSVTTDPTEALPGVKGEIVVHVHLFPEFHVMSNQPSKPSYIPTSVAISDLSGVTFDAPLYPPAARYQLGDEALSTFRGDVDVAVPFTVAATAAEGVHQVSGKVHYQACTAGRCLFPRDEPFVATLHVVPMP